MSTSSFKTLLIMRVCNIIFSILTIFSFEIFGIEKELVIPVLNKEKIYKKKSLEITYINKYIVLETTKNVLIDNDAHIAFASNDLVIITNKKSGDIFLFNSSGRVVSHFNRKERMGYSYLSFLAFDGRKNEIFVLDSFSKNIYVFSIDGKLLRTLKLPNNSNIEEIYNFNDELLLVYHLHLWGSVEINKPYFFVSKKDGKIVKSLNISIKDVNPSIITTQQGKTVTSFRSGHYGIPENCKYGEDFILANKSSDTIYILKKDFTFTPLFTQTPSVFGERSTAVSVGLVTDRYLSLCIYPNDINKAIQMKVKGKKVVPQYRFLIFDRKTGQFYEDVNKAELRVFKTDVPKDITVELLDAYFLKSLLKSGKLSGELKKIATNINIEDNPVIEIKKLKQNGN